MPVEVEFITLGDASSRLNVPPATLRHWTDQLEEYNTHFVLRNNRNERIYYESDLKIFKYLRDLKSEYGRRTTTEDLCYMLIDKAEEGLFELRKREDAPMPSQPSNRTADLLGQEDIQRLMNSERVRQFMDIISKNIKDDLTKKFEDKFAKMNEQLIDAHKKLQEALNEGHKRIEGELNERDKRWEERMEEREKQTNELIAEWRKQNQKPWWKKIFS